MRSLLFFIPLIFILACGQHLQNEAPKGRTLLYAGVKYPSLIRDRENAQVYWSDTLSMYNVRLNELPAFTTLKQLKANIAPDSIRAYEWLCTNPFEVLDKGWPNLDSLVYYHFGESTYISNGNKALIKIARMKGNRFYMLDRKKVFSEQTTIDEFRAVFPKAYTRERQEGKRIDDKGEMIFKVAEGKYEDHWQFKFRNGKLYEVEFWLLLC